MAKITGYKGFGKDFKCRDKQYEVGKTYEESTAIICESGMHFCTVPFDVFRYYAPNTENHFALVEAYADCPKSNDDSKRCTTKLKIVKELSPKEMIEEQAKFSSNFVTMGDQSHSATTGDQSHSATTGDRSHSTTTGRQSIAAALGINGSAAAALNEWIVLADWRKDPDGNYKLHGGKWLKVDGEKIKPNVFYTLVNGEPVEATVD